MFRITRHKRNVFLACTAVAAGGYVSYRIYNSRKRLRVFLFIQSIASLLEALSQGSNSLAVVVGDLHAFLRSDEDEVPQTLKQLMKLAGSHEAQKSVTALSAAISRGVLTTLVSGGSVAVSLQHEDNPQLSYSPQTPRKYGHPEETKNVIKWGSKESLALQGGRGTASIDDRALSPDEEGNAEELWRDCSAVCEDIPWVSAGSVLEGVKAQVGSSIAKGTKDALQEELGEGSSSSRDEVGMHSGDWSGKENFVDKLVENLFSESGKGFVSAVVASASRSLVVSVLEHISTSSFSLRSDEGGGRGELLKGLAEFADSTKGRLLLTDCIQTFVGTAVSVYLDRTKDINTFDELVAGLVKPEHKGPITDLLTTICQVSASSFVRTSHEVLSSDPTSSRQYVGAVTTSLNPVGFPFDNDDDPELFYDDLGDQEDVTPTGWKGKSVAGGRDEAVTMDLIKGLSKVLAVPSNRKLILDIAGTMTSQGVRSVIDVSLGKVSAAFSGKGKGPKDPDSESSKRSRVGEKLQMVGDMTKGAIDKSMVLMTMCFAVCLHSVVGGVRLVQPF